MDASTSAITGAVAGAVAGLAVAGLVDRVSWLWGTRWLPHRVELLLPERDDPTFKALAELRWRLLYVRDGRDDVIPKLSGKEQWLARRKNREKRFHRTRSPFVGARQHTMVARVRFYKPLGLQFKCFVDVPDLETASQVEEFLQSYGYRQTGPPKRRPRTGGSGPYRVWFLPRDTRPRDVDPKSDSSSIYRTVLAEEGGIENAFYYPV